MRLKTGLVLVVTLTSGCVTPQSRRRDASPRTSEEFLQRARSANGAWKMPTNELIKERHPFGLCYEIAAKYFMRAGFIENSPRYSSPAPVIIEDEAQLKGFLGYDYSFFKMNETIVFPQERAIGVRNEGDQTDIFIFSEAGLCVRVWPKYNLSVTQ